MSNELYDMYWQEEQTLSSSNDEPELIITDVFNSLLDTLPDCCPIPTPIIKFGLLTQHIQPKSNNIVTDFDENDIDSANTAVVQPETLRVIEYLVKNHTGHLSVDDKKRVGRLCEAARLDLKNDLGASESAVKEAVNETGKEQYSFLVQKQYTCDHCGETFGSETGRDSHVTDCDQAPGSEESNAEQPSQKRPALGKEIRKDRGSERVTGRNPFADSERLKDTGLHQGGGS